MKMSGMIIWLLGSLSLVFGGIAFAQEDSENCKDHPLLTRMPNFFIENCQESQFAMVKFKDVNGEDIDVEGRLSHIDYQIREGFTPPSGLQVLRNYENAIKKIGGVKVYQEEDTDLWMKLDKQGKTFWIRVDSWHGGGYGESYGLTIVEKKAMSQDVVADARSLMNDILTTGHASIYGIYFDFDKADIKPESEPVIKEMAKLLHENGGLNLYVVGHTDNAGDVDYNMKLSKARADAVMKELVGKYSVSSNRLKAFGVGPLAPVASNQTDDGRARNRRVELVEQ